MINIFALDDTDIKLYALHLDTSILLWNFLQLIFFLSINNFVIQNKFEKLSIEKKIAHYLDENIACEYSNNINYVY